MAGEGESERDVRGGAGGYLGASGGGNEAERDTDSFGASGGGKGRSDSDATSSGGGGGGRRTNVIVKGRYGTTTYPADTGCADCDRRAVGVLVLDASGTDKVAGDKFSKPLCSTHRDELKMGNEETWNEAAFRRFVD